MNKIYVVTRRDLSPGVAAVQCVHAATNLLHGVRGPGEGEWGVYGPHTVILAVDDEEALERWYEDGGLHCLGEAVHAFYEPDYGHQLTAVAYFGPRLSLFDGLQLL